MTELLIFLLATGALVAWWQLMQGRQKARRAAGIVCGNHGLQLLDDTVSLSSITWNRTGSNAPVLVGYSFEFATNGAIRRRGVVTLGAPAAMTVTLDLEEGRLIETIKAS
jgi:hypothetical protein